MEKNQGVGIDERRRNQLIRDSQDTAGRQIHHIRDIDYLRKLAKENIMIYVDEGLPEEYEKCLVG